MADVEVRVLTSDAVDTHRSMIPTSGVAHQRQCDRCGSDIESFEAHHTGRITGARWCDECFQADRDDE